VNVLLAIPDLFAATGGPPVVVTQLAAALRDLGDTVSLVFADKADERCVPILDGINARAVPWQANPWRRYQWFRRAVLETIQSEQIQVVHDHGLWQPQNAAVASAALATACPLVLQPCGMMQAWSLAQRPVKKRVAWWLYQEKIVKHAVALITTSTREQEEAQLCVGASPVVHCIPHGVEIPDMADVMERRRQAVFLGRLHPVKQIEVLIRAWAAIRPVGWQLCIAGHGELAYEAKLKSEVHALGLDKHIVFLGTIHGAEKSQLLRQSQLYVQASLQENFGLSVAEALAHGVPALTTHAMPWAQLEANHCGWSVPVDEQSVTAALRAALSLSAEALAEMGARARELAKTYAWSETAGATHRLYEKLGA